MTATTRSQPVRVVRAVARTAVRAGAYGTASARGLPDFLLIGTKRGGTTSLYRQLEMHPAYVPLFPSAARLPMRENMKGVHFFDTNFHRGRRWYRSHFQTVRSRDAHHDRHGASFTGDASPYYLFHPLAAQRAATVVPDAKLVVLLRDPVERTISHWAEQTRNGTETLTLVDALDRERERLGDSAQLLLDGTIKRNFAHEQQSYAGQSQYAQSLRRWLQHFPREKLLVLFSEDYYANPVAVLGEVTDFLGLPRYLDVDVGVRNAASRTGHHDEVRERLGQQFADDAAAVAAIVGRPPPWDWFPGAREPAG